MDAQKALKRIYIISYIFLVFWGVFLLAYFLVTRPLFSMQLGQFFYMLHPTIKFEPEESMLISFLQLWTLRINNFTIGIWGPVSSIVLFRINIISEPILTTLVFAPLLSAAITLPFSGILLRLVKDFYLDELYFNYLPWNLAPSNRYKTYGEAKNRIKHLIKNGTLKEKTAIYMSFPSSFLIFICMGIFFFLLVSPYFISWDFLFNLSFMMIDIIFSS